MSRERLLVTGGASGIGRAIAVNGVKAGLDVVVIDRDRSEIGTSIVADLSNRAATSEALKEAMAGGPITRLVNNVGAVFPCPIDRQSLSEVDQSINLNLVTAVQCSQALLEGMREAAFGRIVNMTSRASLGKENRTAYAAAKAGLIGMTKVWSLELADAGITVNAVGPGPIATDLFLKANPPGSEQTQKIIENVPVQRMGTPEDVSAAAHFFLQESAGFVTGQVLYVCGGMTVGASAV